MKKFILVFIIIFLFIIPLKSTNMTIGFHWHTGKTFGERDLLISSEFDTLHSWDPSFSGYFLQILFKLKKISFGLEYGKNQLYEYYGSSTINHSQYGYSDTYKPARVLALFQYQMIKNLSLQSGFGIHLTGPRSSQSKGPFLGLMTSIRYEIKVINNIILPIFVRADLNGTNGTPISLSLGIGIVLKWKSGL